MLAEDIAKREAMEIVFAIEESREFDAAVESLISLPEAIRSARQSLIDAGCYWSCDMSSSTWSGAMSLAGPW